MKTLKYWILASRPWTLLISLTTIITANAIAVKNQEWDPTVFILTALLTLCLQLLANYANDVGDYLKGADKDRSYAPKRLVQENKISIRAMVIAIIISIMINVVIGITLLYRIYVLYGVLIMGLFLLIGCIALIAAITYTIGQRAYGYYGLGDLISLIFFGPVAVIGILYLYHGGFSFEAVLPALAIGLMTASVLNANNLRDHINDIEAKKHTMVVWLGLELGKKYHFFLESVALLCLALYHLIFIRSWGGGRLSFIVFIISLYL